MKTVIMVYDFLRLEDIKSSKYVDCFNVRKYYDTTVKIKQGKTKTELRQKNDKFIDDVIKRIKESKFEYVAIRYSKNLLKEIKKNFKLIIVIPNISRYLEFMKKEQVMFSNENINLFNLRVNDETLSLKNMHNNIENILSEEDYVFALGENKYFKDFIKLFFR